MSTAPAASSGVPFRCSAAAILSIFGEDHIAATSGGKPCGGASSSAALSSASHCGSSACRPCRKATRVAAYPEGPHFGDRFREAEHAGLG